MISLKTIFRSKIIWILILLLMFYAMYVFSDKYAKILQLRENIRLLESEIKILKSENEKLSKEIDWLNQEKSIEKIAREKLGLTKPNEILIKGIEE